MKLDSDDFELFGLERRFEQDASAIDRRWRELQGEVHPDRFAAAGAAAQRVAVQWAARVNEAYRRLKNPLQRAVQLCELHGAPIDAHCNTAMPTDFLMQQMAWREALDDASDVAVVERLHDDVKARRREALAQLRSLCDERHDYVGAARQVRALMFVERFADDLDARLEALGQ
jgi:molecular chaperone HscB